MSAFVSPLAAIAQALTSTSGGITVLRKAHKDSDHTAEITVVHCCLHAETHRAG